VNDEEARLLAGARQRAREAKDFALADVLRDRLRQMGFEVMDTRSGSELRAIETAAPVYRRSSEVPSVLADPSVTDVSVHWVVEGWPEDVERGIASFRRHEGDRSVQHVVVDAAGLVRSWPDGTECVQVDPQMGWAAARNSGLRRSTGSLIVIVDGSIEATGDAFTPLEAALGDPTVGVTGPFGIISEEMHHFHESAGPEVDAVEGYLMAFRRELLDRDLRFDEKFKFYRTCDIELSFHVKAIGLRAMVTPLPVTRHEHRMWTTTPEDERARLSKRNFYRFLDKWRDRSDLLVSHDRS
jgi:cysteinyl-tRNA synthetase